MAVFGCDFGSSMFHVCKEGKRETYSKFDVDSFIELPFANSGDVILIELAHLQPQKDAVVSGISLSQGLTYEKLLLLEQNLSRKNVLLKVVPHSLTPRLRAEFFPKEQKKDDVDAAAIYYFWVFYHKRNCLQNFKPHKPGHFSDSLKLSFEIKKEMDYILNWFRGNKGDNERISIVPVLKLYLKHAHRTIDFESGFIGYKSSADAYTEKWLFGKKDNGSNLLPFNENSLLCALWVCVFDYNGNLRLNPNTQKPLGINFIWKKVLANKFNHFKGGVGRSNLYYHGFKQRVLPSELRFDGFLEDGSGRKKKISLDPNNDKRMRLNKFRREYAAVCKNMLRKMQQLDLQDSGPDVTEKLSKKLKEQERLKELKAAAKRLQLNESDYVEKKVFAEQSLLW